MYADREFCFSDKGTIEDRIGVGAEKPLPLFAQKETKNKLKYFAARLLQVVVVG